MVCPLITRVGVHFHQCGVRLLRGVRHLVSRLGQVRPVLAGGVRGDCYLIDSCSRFIYKRWSHIVYKTVHATPGGAAALAQSPRRGCTRGDGVGTVRPLLRRAKNAARPSLCSCRRSRPFRMVAAMLQPPRHQPVHRQIGAGCGCAQVVAQRAVKAVFQGLDQRACLQFVFHQAGGHDAHAKA